MNTETLTLKVDTTIVSDALRGELPVLADIYEAMPQFAQCDPFRLIDGRMANIRYNGNNDVIVQGFIEIAAIAAAAARRIKGTK
jgi:hypothetical protein